MPWRKKCDGELSGVNTGILLGSQTQSQTPFTLARRLHSQKTDVSVNCCVRLIVFLGKKKKKITNTAPS